MHTDLVIKKQEKKKKENERVFRLEGTGKDQGSRGKRLVLTFL